MIAFQATKRGLTDRETTMEDTHVWVMNADGTNRRDVGGGVDNRQGAPEWTRGRQRACCSPCRNAATSRLYQHAGATAASAEIVVSERGTVGSFSASEEHHRVHACDASRSGGAVSSAGKKLTDLNAAVLRGKPLAEVESFTFISNDNKFEVEAFLTKPLGLTATAKYPLIVNIHGGPHGQQGPAFNFKNQVYAARGWATLMVNYRGSTGYGQAFADAVFADQNGNEGSGRAVRRQRRAAPLSVDRSRSARRRGHQLRRSAVDVADHADQHLQGGDSHRGDHQHHQLQLHDVLQPVRADGVGRRIRIRAT